MNQISTGKWVIGPNGERYDYEEYATKKKAIAAATVEYGSSFYVAQKVELEFTEHDTGSPEYHVVECMQESLWDNAGEYGETWEDDNVTADDLKELGNKIWEVVAAWIKENKCQPTCSIVENAEQIMGCPAESEVEQCKKAR